MNRVNDRAQDDDAIAMDIRVCSINFVEKKTATFVNFSVAIRCESGSDPDGDDEINLDIIVPADPENETIVMIVERCRLAVIARLKATAGLIEETPVRKLLFGENAR